MDAQCSSICATFTTIDPAWLPDPAWYRWTSPKTLLEGATQRIAATPKEVFFNAPSLKPVREAWIAGTFADRVAAGRPDRVRLVDDRFPDFEVLRGNATFPFEVTEIDAPDRRRGKEYREIAQLRAEGHPLPDEYSDHHSEATAAIPLIIEGVRKKAEKRYASSVHLLLYVNRWPPAAFGHSVSRIAEGIDNVRDAFLSIWLLWGSEVVRCWPKPARMLRTDDPGAKNP